MERLSLEGDAGARATELAIHVARYALVAALCRGRRVLDVACGNGYGSHLMVARWGAAELHAVDVSAAALAAARAAFDDPRITWHEMDAARLDRARFGGPFDLITSFETIEHLADPAAFLHALRALLRPEGTLVVSCPNDPWYYGPGRTKNPFHRQAYTFADFRALAEPVLGAARAYFLGGTAGGFANVAVGRDGLPAARPPRLFDGVGARDAQVIPNDAGGGPTAAESLYYVGVWGPVAPAETATYVPLSPERVFRVDGSRPRLAFQRRARPRLLLVADVRGWAFDNIAQHIRRHLGDVFEVEVVNLADFADGVACLYEIVFEREPDIVHFFWREYLFDMLLGHDVAAIIAERYNKATDDFLGRLAMTVITTSVYDHLFSDDTALGRRAPLFWYVDGYNVSSEKLRAVYDRPPLPPPDVVIEDGVDLELFQPPAADRWAGGARELVVGWAGNGDWNRTETRDPKGLHTVLKPALARLQAEGFPVSARFMDSAERRVPRDEMPAFYRGLDVYVCVSEIEGTPNPVLEAMACGTPIVSTDVGIVPQVFGPEQRQLILAERTPEALAAALKRLIGRPDLLRRLSAENLARIQSWSWAHQMPKWLQLFTTAARRLDVRAEQRRRSLHLVREAVLARTHLERGAERELLVQEHQAQLAALEDHLNYLRSGRGAAAQVGRQLRARVGRHRVLGTLLRPAAQLWRALGVGNGGRSLPR